MFPLPSLIEDLSFLEDSDDQTTTASATNLEAADVEDDDEFSHCSSPRCWLAREEDDEDLSFLADPDDQTTTASAINLEAADVEDDDEFSHYPSPRCWLAREIYRYVSMLLN
ncbi:hypothetical protein ACFE04_026912 [Oxalis oulophora]